MSTRSKNQKLVGNYSMADLQAMATFVKHDWGSFWGLLLYIDILIERFNETGQRPK